MIQRILSFILTVGALLLIASPAIAVTASGQIRYFDERTWRSNDTGSRVWNSTWRTNQGLYRPVLYFYKQIGSCRDFASTCGEVNDQYLGYAEASAGGTYSKTDLPASSTVYMVFDFRLRDPSASSKYARVFDNTGSSILALSVSKYLTGDITWNWNVSCPSLSSATCTTTDANSSANIQLHSAANILATTGLVDQYGGGLWGMNGYTGIHIFFPDSPNNDCASSGGGVSINASDFCTTVPFANAVNAHELGHLLHKRLLDINGSVSGCTGGPWTTERTEKCATAEGWADFVALATHWTQGGSTASLPALSTDGWIARNAEGDTMLGNLVSYECVSRYKVPQRRIGNVARFFWDIYDSTTVGDDGNDALNQTFTSIRAVWDLFPPGTDDRQANESGLHGRNIYDYLEYAPWSSSALNNIQDQNCLQGQIQ